MSCILCDCKRNAADAALTWLLGALRRRRRPISVLTLRTAISHARISFNELAAHRHDCHAALLAGFTQRRVAGSMSGFLQHLLT
jgi:hypothetical protein